MMDKKRDFTSAQVEAFNKINPVHQGLEELEFAWDEYAMAPDSDLHESGLKLKYKLLALAHEEVPNE
ncbi:hypothetical protein LCGC14_1279110 [marine sediment metagenome]|uniref:Uncharacterized protein n=1 Tax=marine sediment metagenome TaxID=412755 RepID=A0A0F9NYV1_9ZZZZ